MYTVAGEPAEAEMSSLEWLPGYRGSLPVHVGNSAASQLQLGAYGDLMDAVWRYCEDSARLDADDTRSLAALVDHLCAQWRSEDSGLWELSSHEHYTSSKLGCWVALDRAVRLAEDGQLPDLRLTRWRAERDTVRAWIDEHCWSQTKQSYTFYAGTDELDVATLLMARTRFLAPDDPRLASTIKAVRTELSAGGPLLYRYTGMAEQEGAFLVCTFWLIEALAFIGRRDEAAALLEQALGYAGHVGLFSEELDPATGELRGNLPQGLTHLGVIGAATALAAGAPGG